VTPQTDALHKLLPSEPIAVGDLILLEVLQGISDVKEFQLVEKMLLSFTIVDLCGRDIAIGAAMNCRHLRAMGVTVRRSVDTLIATWCIENGCALLHSDRDFDHFAKYLGLRVIAQT
jgi:predicted nucleic acid-binding protein